MRALIVEGDTARRRAMAALLRSLGFEASAVRCVCEARWLLAIPPPPQVLITQLWLPDGSAIEILQLLRRLELSISTALISAAGDPMVGDAMALRPQTVFGEPLDFKSLRAWLAGLLENESRGRDCSEAF